jgi:hypothetical protein
MLPLGNLSLQSNYQVQIQFFLAVVIVLHIIVLCHFIHIFRKNLHF